MFTVETTRTLNAGLWPLLYWAEGKEETENLVQHSPLSASAPRRCPDSEEDTLAEAP